MYTCLGRGRVYLCGYLWRQKRVSDPLELELQYRFWELNSDPGKELEALLITEHL